MINPEKFINKNRTIHWGSACPPHQLSCNPDIAAQRGKTCPPLSKASRPLQLDTKGNICFPREVLKKHLNKSITSEKSNKQRARDMVIELAKFAAALEKADCSMANVLDEGNDRNAFCGFIRKNGKKKCEIKNKQCTEIQSQGGTNSSSDDDSDTENSDEFFDSSSHGDSDTENSDVEESGSGNLLQKGIQVVTDVLNKAFTGEEGVLNDTIHDDMLNVMNDTRTYPNTLREK